MNNLNENYIVFETLFWNPRSVWLLISVLLTPQMISSALWSNVERFGSYNQLSCQKNPSPSRGWSLVFMIVACPWGTPWLTGPANHRVKKFIGSIAKFFTNLVSCQAMWFFFCLSWEHEDPFQALCLTLAPLIQVPVAQALPLAGPWPWPPPHTAAGASLPLKAHSCYRARWWSAL